MATKKKAPAAKKGTSAAHLTSIFGHNYTFDQHGTLALRLSGTAPGTKTSKKVSQSTSSASVTTLFLED